MDAGQIFAVVWGVLAVGLGVLFIVKREAISELAKQQGSGFIARTQSPRLLLGAGVFFICAGLFVIVGMVIVAVR
ncbi:hypothetical protein ET445_09375 [Agromyces protaetiae]|uniref:Uncharacterized protein n=1 Tax=Agromyces protaetiae TaxID=2509455 RepID=A0A4P6FCI3_9MICO|nr:hypothetical protein [Agromyces protaetiae]QAY73515.1 hypothetical protein ET445_09375 [Agromyces protaetiae]